MSQPDPLLPPSPAPRPPRAEFDGSLALLREGYDFARHRFEKHGADIFETRIGLAKAVFVFGEDAARMFYDAADKFTRKGALPQITLRLLQDKGSVQWLDGEAHHHRKAIFLNILMDEAQVAALVRAFRDEWGKALPEWERKGRITFLHEASQVVAAAVVRWSGLDLEPRETRRLGWALFSMSDNAARIGPRAWAALWRRRHTERWLKRRLAALRRNLSALPADAPIRAVLTHRDLDGELLPPEVATVEVINLLRPTVAVGRFMMWAALALHLHPEWRERFSRGEEDMLDAFAEEVRRFFPFLPMIGGRVTKAFEWRGHRFAQGAWVLLDLESTNHDARRFPQPFRFEPSTGPERGMSWRDQGFDYVPHGGGDAAVSHRCPGEMVSHKLIKEAVRLLCREAAFSVPAQDLLVRRSRIPAQPESGLVLEVRRV
jgi:fatty-acid peroxygenase